MRARRCHVSELPNDLQILVFDFVEDSLGERVVDRLKNHRFRLLRCRYRHSFDALGHGGESHQMQLTASLTRIRRTFTHSAGVESFAGFHK
jgi:hypothetical protein